MEEKFTIEQIKAYIKSQDSLGDVMYNLSADNIKKANTPETIDECYTAIKNNFSFDTVLLKDDEIVVEEDTCFDSSDVEYDTVYELARDHGEMICEKFPMLEVWEIEAHKTYAITTLRLKL